MASRELTPEMRRLRGWFVVTLVLGIAAIVVAWLLDAVLPTNVTVVITLAGPIVAMVVYVYVGREVEGADGKTDAFADSVYYMGFLFTLCALIVALVAEDDSTGVLKSRFGIALITTIVGLSFRTVLANFRSTASDSLLAVEAQLVRSSNSLRDQFSSISDTMVLMTSGFRTTVKVTNDALEAAADKFRSSSDRLANDFSRSGGRLGTTAGDIEQQVGTALGNLNQTVTTAQDHLAAGADAYRQRLEGVRVDPDFLERQFRPSISRLEEAFAGLAEGLDKSRKEIEAQAEAYTQTTKAAADAVSLFAERADGLKNTASALAKSIAQSSDSLGNLGDGANKHAEEMTRHAASLKKLTGQAELDLQTIEEHRETLARSLQRSSDAISAVHDSLVDAVAEIRTKLG